MKHRTGELVYKTEVHFEEALTELSPSHIIESDRLYKFMFNRQLSNVCERFEKKHKMWVECIPQRKAYMERRFPDLMKSDNYIGALEVIVKGNHRIIPLTPVDASTYHIHIILEQALTEMIDDKV